jgi:hypothetical protein
LINDACPRRGDIDYRRGLRTGILATAARSRRGNPANARPTVARHPRRRRRTCGGMGGRFFLPRDTSSAAWRLFREPNSARAASEPNPARVTGGPNPARAFGRAASSAANLAKSNPKSNPEPNRAAMAKPSPISHRNTGNGEAEHPANRNGEAEPNLHRQRHDGEAEPPTTAMAKPSRTGQYVIGQPVMTEAEQQTQPRTTAIGA